MKTLFAVAIAVAFVPAWAQAPAKKEAAKADPKLTECRAANQKAHGEVVKIHADAKKAGTMSQAEEKHFHKMDQTLRHHRAMMAKDGLSLAECQKLSAEIAREKAAAERMAASPVKKK